MTDLKYLLVSCDLFHGTPQCMGASAQGPEHCTCRIILRCDPANMKVEPVDEAVCESAAWEDFCARGSRQCKDCAFRADSPETESGALERVKQTGGPFFCHSGMPLDCRDLESIKDAAARASEMFLGYAGERRATGIPNGYAPCMGWINWMAGNRRRVKKLIAGASSEAAHETNAR